MTSSRVVKIRVWDFFFNILSFLNVIQYARIGATWALIFCYGNCRLTQGLSSNFFSEEVCLKGPWADRVDTGHDSFHVAGFVLCTLDISLFMFPRNSDYSGSSIGRLRWAWPVHDFVMLAGLLVTHSTSSCQFSSDHRTGKDNYRQNTER